MNCTACFLLFIFREIRFSGEASVMRCRVFFINESLSLIPVYTIAVRITEKGEHLFFILIHSKGLCGESNGNLPT